MKKRRFAIALILSACLFVSACGSSEDAGEDAKNENVPQEQEQEPVTQVQEQIQEPKAEMKSETLHIYDSALGGKTALYLCEIENTGDVPIRISNISIDVEDANGTILTSTDYVSAYPDVIAPGQVSYICEQVIGALDTGIDASTASKAMLHCNIESRDPSPVSAEITQATLGEKMTYPNLTGKIKNTGTEDLSMVYVSAPVFSADGSLQTVIFTIIDDLSAGEEKGFEQMAVYCDLSMDYSGSTLGEISVYKPTLF